MHARWKHALGVLLITLAVFDGRCAETVSVIKRIRESENMSTAANFTTARDLALQAVQADPAHAPAWLQLGAVELRDQRYPEAIKAIRESLIVDPSQTSAWKLVALAEWNAGRSDEAILSLRKYLSIMPADTVAQHDLAVWLSTIGEQREATGILSRLARSGDANPRIWKELGSLLFRQGDYESARDAYEESLKQDPDDSGVHRDLAWCYWNMHEKSAARPLLEKALASVLAYLQSDSGNVPMNVMAGRIMSALDRKDQARDHYSALLARNPDFAPSLVYLRQDAAERSRPADALAFARRRTDFEPSNLEAQLDLANSLAQNDQFRPALKILRRLASMPATEATLLLAYQLIDESEGPGRNTIDQLMQHFDILAERGYRMDNRFSDESTIATSKVVLIFQGASEKDLQSIDARLAALEGRAIYAGSIAGDHVRRTTKPTAAFLKSLEQTGRWLILPAVRLERKCINQEGVLGNPLTHRIYEDGRMESEEEMTSRVRAFLAQMFSHAYANPERVCIYPFGDYGQRSLDMSREDAVVLSTSVAEVFSYGIYFADQGYHAGAANPLTVPALEVSPVTTPEIFALMLTRANPLVSSRLELAKALYWNRQYEQAHDWFARAEAEGADPFALYFSWGACADNQSDIPTAMDKIAKARAIDPDDDRLQALSLRADDRRSSRISAGFRHWDDNENRSFNQISTEGSLFAGDSIRLGLLAGNNVWKQKGKGDERGIRAGISARAFVLPQVWLDATVWNLDMERTDDLAGGDILLHAPCRWTSGFIELSAGRDEMETVEALRAGISTDNIRLHHYSRVQDRFDLFASVLQQKRSDDNDTLGVDGRLLYRVREWPYLGIGYHVRLADSDRDPAEYWAPEQLEQHQAHLNLRRTFGNHHVSVSGDAGYAREQDNDWRFVWGANASLETLIYRTVALRVQGQHHESPTYHRTTGTLGLGIDF